MALVVEICGLSVHMFRRLASQRIEIAIAAFSNRKIQSRNSHRRFRRKIAEKSRNENRKSLRFEIANAKSQCFFVCEIAKTSRGCPNFQKKNRCDFWGARFEITAFPRFQNRSVRDARLRRGNAWPKDSPNHIGPIWMNCFRGVSANFLP